MGEDRSSGLSSLFRATAAERASRGKQKEDVPEIHVQSDGRIIFYAIQGEIRALRLFATASLTSQGGKSRDAHENANEIGRGEEKLSDKNLTYSP